MDNEVLIEGNICKSITGQEDENGNFIVEVEASNENLDLQNQRTLQSALDESKEYFLTNGVISDDIPEEYDYSEYCELHVRNQGSTSKCVPFSISTMLECMNYEVIDYDLIYNSRPNYPEDGMKIRDGLKYLKKTYNDPFFQYFRLSSIWHIKNSIIANGPCILALPVKDNESTLFWKGTGDFGGHAICCVGYNKEGYNRYAYRFNDNNGMYIQVPRK